MIQSSEKEGFEQMKGKTNLTRSFVMDDNNNGRQLLKTWPSVLTWAKECNISEIGFSKTLFTFQNGMQLDTAEKWLQWRKKTNGTEEVVIKDCHEAGFKVNVFTFREGKDPSGEFKKFLELGVDGFFTDFPGTANEFLKSECQVANGYIQ